MASLIAAPVVVAITVVAAITVVVAISVIVAITTTAVVVAVAISVVAAVTVGAAAIITAVASVAAAAVSVAAVASALSTGACDVDGDVAAVILFSGEGGRREELCGDRGRPVRRMGDDGKGEGGRPRREHKGRHVLVRGKSGKGARREHQLLFVPAGPFDLHRSTSHIRGSSASRAPILSFLGQAFLTSARVPHWCFEWPLRRRQVLASGHRFGASHRGHRILQPASRRPSRVSLCCRFIGRVCASGQVPRLALTQSCRRMRRARRGRLCR
mmetsp:Transcript_15811/g.51621  ORF Transcript_15811/g.51621 Transcript_15811/m.51621 type:complete len:271 (-) Transcript_15811:209-1021(-)